MTIGARCWQPTFTRHDRSRAHTADGFCCARIQDLSVQLGSQRVLENINLHVHCGEMMAIIGPNGAGKTTLLRALLGEVSSVGAFTFNAVRGGRPARAPRLGYVPQKLDLDATAPMTVLDMFAAALTRWPLMLPRAASVRARAQEALARVAASELLTARVGVLSGGQLQRVLLALALTPVPDILLLDEPLAAVDRAGVQTFYHTVAELRNTFDLSIIMVSHDIADVARVADTLVCLNRRVVRAGPPWEVLADPDVIALLGGARFTP